MSRTNHHRGELSEYRVGVALEEIQKDEELLQGLGIRRIDRIKHAAQNSDLDKRHVDFLVRIELTDLAEKDKVFRLAKDVQNAVVETRPATIIPVPIQVKSHERKRREFERWMDLEKTPHIRSLSVGVREKCEHIKEKVVQCLRTAIRMFREGMREAFATFNQFFESSPHDDAGHKHHVSSKERRRRRRENYVNRPPINQGNWRPQHCFVRSG